MCAVNLINREHRVDDHGRHIRSINYSSEGNLLPCLLRQEVIGAVMIRHLKIKAAANYCNDQFIISEFSKAVFFSNV